MIFEKYGYVKYPRLTGDAAADVREILERNGKAKTFVHVRNVAEVSRGIARQFGLDEEKCAVSGLLHDISAVLAPADMLNYAEENGFDLCDAERKFPFLLHQRISRIAAEEAFGIRDLDVLTAIECHTTLKEAPTGYEMALFLADKLAWDQDGAPPFYDEVKNALNRSMEKACWEYMRYMNDNGKVLCPHTNWDLAYEWLEKRVG